MTRSAEALKKEWLATLTYERRMSPHTLRAYGDDMERFLDFAQDHVGGALDEEKLEALRPADFRAFISRRRNDSTIPRRRPRAHRSSRALCPGRSAKQMPRARFKKPQITTWPGSPRATPHC